MIESQPIVVHKNDADPKSEERMRLRLGARRLPVALLHFHRFKKIR